jgi:putative NAD(P)-binding protein
LRLRDPRVLSAHQYSKYRGNQPVPNITRRDFLEGSALAIAAGMAPIDLLSANSQDANYPPIRTGLRGSHPGSFEVAHALGREGQHFDTDSVAVSDKYDLIVVGAGISGLSAAYFYRGRRPNAKILIVDNHDDFGGHAKRNEFHINGRMLLSCGGAELMLNADGWSDSVRQGIVARSLFQSGGLWRRPGRRGRSGQSAADCRDKSSNQTYDQRPAHRS